MFRITPIGSCRIYGPLREFGEGQRFQLNAKRVFGLMHSSAEAVQQMHAFTSEFSCEEDLWQLIAKGKDYEKFQAEVHEKSDLYIVELSSAKVLKIDDTVLQLNYLNSQFIDFFSDNRRAVAFTQACMRNSPAAVNAFLKDAWDSTPEQRKESDILRRIEISMATEDSIYEDICKLQDGLDEIMIVTHVNAKNENSTPLLSREKYINQVIAAAKRAGAPLYNPTDLMEQIGQDKAIEDHSTAFAHFTGMFNGRLFEDWYEHKLLPIMERAIRQAPEENIKSMLLPVVDGVLESGTAAQAKQLAELLETLKKDLPKQDGIAPLQQKLAGTVLSEAAL